MTTTATIIPKKIAQLLPNLNLDNVHFQLSPDELREHIILNGEGIVTDTGALMCDTGHFTGRSPKDKFIVKDRSTKDIVAWGSINQPFDSQQFERLRQKMMDFVADSTLYVRCAKACSSEAHGINILVINTLAWHNLFCNHLFIRPEMSKINDFKPDWTILNIPEFEADPATDGTRQGNFTIIDFMSKTILIGGTAYAGEMKKGIFSVLNYTLPQADVLSMHCSANIGKSGDTALFFGLSGTGKTTLSADPNRNLIGDDEHGWDDMGIFNFEGGCYAKVIDLSEDKEPEIFAAIRYNSILENTRFVPGTKTVDYTNTSITENTRTAYPLDNIANAANPSVGGVPANIFFLTCDAFGVLPPISKLTAEQAMQYFLMGYTAKVAGTEMGITEPQVTFSACFGAAFLPLVPSHYAKLLGKKIKENNVTVWLINTGWTGGQFGIGSRIKLKYTRAMIAAALGGQLNDVPFATHPIFNLLMPTHCPDVDSDLLNPQATWQSSEDYNQTANRLAEMFGEQLAKLGI
jgi:phosphoenolpyruvate carboxykinase (ATP)